MVQILQSEEIDCPICGTRHPSTLYGFPKAIFYGQVKLGGVEYYHSCPVRKEFFQTGHDVNQTFIAERVIKKQYDQMLQQQNQQQGWTVNINR